MCVFVTSAAQAWEGLLSGAAGTELVREAVAVLRLVTVARRLQLMRFHV